MLCNKSLLLSFVFADSVAGLILRKAPCYLKLSIYFKVKYLAIKLKSFTTYSVIIDKKRLLALSKLIIIFNCYLCEFVK